MRASAGVIVACPTCGASVEFRYDDSFVRVCSSCNSSVARTDRGIETLGKFADLVPIDSQLKLFAEGHFAGASFLLVGMAQLRHAAGGVWQEWYAKMGGGQWGWLSEAQGRVYLTFERGDVQAPPLQSLAPNTQVMLGNAPFVVSERNTATYVAAAGEIPYRLHPNTTFTFVDLSDGQGGFATIDYNDGSEPPAVYVGRQVSAAELRMSGGEDPTPQRSAAQGKAIACPNCGGSLDLRAGQHTLRIACPYCGTIVDTEGPAPAIVAQQQRKPTFDIPLGTKGTFSEGEMTVIGYVRRLAHIDGETFPFDEYLLYAPNVGFRWLVQSDGHWSYVQPVATGAVEMGTRYKGVPFKHFQSAKLGIDSVLGEFYWRVSVGDMVQADDYIAPPAMLSRESTSSEQNWSLGTYMTRAEVERALGVKIRSRSTGVAPNQPYSGGVVTAMSLITLAFLAVGVVKCSAAKNARRLDDSFTVPPTPKAATPPPADPATAEAAEATGAVHFTPKFHLEGGQNIAIDVAAGVSNNWAYTAVDLVNEATGEVVSVDQSLEYYSGVDDGESWSEGSQTGREVLGPVEAGDYVLRVEASHGAPNDLSINVQVTQSVFRWMWFLVALGVLLVPFGFVALFAYTFHKNRWKNSNTV